MSKRIFFIRQLAQLLGLSGSSSTPLAIGWLPERVRLQEGDKIVSITLLRSGSGRSTAPAWRATELWRSPVERN